jgi:hypothetical protein
VQWDVGAEDAEHGGGHHTVADCATRDAGNDLAEEVEGYHELQVEPGGERRAQAGADGDGRHPGDEQRRRAAEVVAVCGSRRTGTPVAVEADGQGRVDEEGGCDGTEPARRVAPVGVAE